MNVQVKWVQNMQFVGTNQDGHNVVMDAKVVNGGDGSGPTPMELLLQSIAGCTGMDIIHTVKKMRIEIDTFSMEVSGVRVEEHPKRFTEIEIVYCFEGNDLEVSKLRKAINLSKDKYCSVSNTLNANIDYRLRINGIDIEE